MSTATLTSTGAKPSSGQSRPSVKPAHSPARTEYDALSMLDLLDARELEHYQDSEDFRLAGTPREKVKNNPMQGRRLSGAKNGSF